jgi:succinoglycan biosynthesis transport protein ExoP
MLSIPFSMNGHSRLDLSDASEAFDRLLPGERNGHSLVTHPGDPLGPFCEALRDRLILYFDYHRMGQKPKLVALTSLSRNAGVSTLASGLAASLSDASEGKVLLVDKPLAAKRAYDLIKDYKASEFDYVIFDMPALNDTSATLPIAGFMDKVLLVVEAEKSSLEGVKRAYAQLAASTKVSVVFNKSRAYGPRWIKGDL